MALEVSLKKFLVEGMEARFKQHIDASLKIKSAIERLGMSLVPLRPEIAANTLTAVYYPTGVAPAELLKSMTSLGVVVAGGLHPHHNTKYFRIGHMNISASDPSNGHLDKVISALELSLQTAKI